MARGSTGRGALIAIAAAGLVLIVVGASRARLGFGVIGDVLIGLVVVAVLSLTYAAASTLAVRLMRRLPPLTTGGLVGVVIGVAVGLAALLGASVVRPLAIVVLAVVGLWGAVAGDLWSYRRVRSLPRRAPLRMVGAIAASGVLWLGLARESTAGQGEHTVASLRLPSSATTPSYAVSRYRYGSGANARRAEYGDSAAARTLPMDLTAVVPALVGWRQDVHRNYWKVDLAEAPRNATVWLPDAPQPHPVVLMMHGVGTDERSEEGLGYLGESLAAAGYAAVAIDANYLSGPWVDGTDGVIAARVALVLGHLQTLASLNADRGTPFGGAFDLSQVVLMGHSRGGEAVAAAAMLAGLETRPDLPTLQLAPETRVRAVVALSPTEGLYAPGGRAIQLENVPYLLVRGSLDADVPPSAGTGQYERVTLDPRSAAFKAAVVLPGANHAQFNARWGARDLKPPLSWLLARDAVLPARLQREVTGVVVRTFLEEALEPMAGAAPRFEGAVAAVAASSAVPVALRISSARSIRLATFDEDADLSTASVATVRAEGQGLQVWTEGTNPRSGNAYLRLAWNRAGATSPPQYALQLLSAADLALDGEADLVLNAASLSGDLRFTVELEDAAGVTARAGVDVPEDAEYTRRTRRWRSLLLDASVVPTTLPALRTYVIPIRSLASSAGFDLRRTVALRLVFDGTPAAGLIVDDIGIRPASRPTVAQR